MSNYNANADNVNASYNNNTINDAFSNNNNNNNSNNENNVKEDLSNNVKFSFLCSNCEKLKTSSISFIHITASFNNNLSTKSDYVIKECYLLNKLDLVYYLLDKKIKVSKIKVELLDTNNSDSNKDNQVLITYKEILCSYCNIIIGIFILTSSNNSNLITNSESIVIYKEKVYLLNSSISKPSKDRDVYIKIINSNIHNGFIGNETESNKEKTTIYNYSNFNYYDSNYTKPEINEMFKKAMAKTHNYLKFTKSFISNKQLFISQMSSFVNDLTKDISKYSSFFYSIYEKITKTAFKYNVINEEEIKEALVKEEERLEINNGGKDFDNNEELSYFN